jgi:hypothetical protein
MNIIIIIYAAFLVSAITAVIFCVAQLKEIKEELGSINFFAINKKLVYDALTYLLGKCIEYVKINNIPVMSASVIANSAENYDIKKKLVDGKLSGFYLPRNRNIFLRLDEEEDYIIVFLHELCHDIIQMKNNVVNSESQCAMEMSTFMYENLPELYWYALRHYSACHGDKSFTRLYGNLVNKNNAQKQYSLWKQNNFQWVQKE